MTRDRVSWALLLFLDADRLCGIIRIRMANSCRDGRRVGPTVYIHRGGGVGWDTVAGMRAAVLVVNLISPLQLFGRYGSRVSHERASVVARRSRGLLCVNTSAPSREGQQKKGKQCDHPRSVLTHTNPQAGKS